MSHATGYKSKQDMREPGSHRCDCLWLDFLGNVSLFVILLTVSPSQLSSIYVFVHSFTRQPLHLHIIMMNGNLE